MEWNGLNKIEYGTNPKSNFSWKWWMCICAEVIFLKREISRISHKGETGGPSRLSCQEFWKYPLPPLFLCQISLLFLFPHKKVESFLFFMSPSLLVVEHIGKKGLIGFRQILVKTSLVACIFRSTIVTYLKKHIRISTLARSLLVFT